MPFLTELDVVNAQLATMGEAPLNELTDDHPFVAAGLRILKVANYREQSKGWWFNTEWATLAPDPVNSSISVPDDTISINPSDSYKYAVRGRRLYDLTRQSYAFTKSVKVEMLRYVNFEDLPGSFSSLVQLDATKDFQLEYDADRFKAQTYENQRTEMLMVVNAEHTRQRKANLLHSYSAQAKFNSLGHSPVYGDGFLPTHFKG